MITPAYLKENDKVAIVAPARRVSRDELEPAIKILKSWGLEVIPGKNLFKSFHQFSGTDEERAFDIQQMMDDASIKAIFCARGGYGTVRIIDKLDFRQFVRDPKWFVGFSDLTVLHSHIQSHFGIETLHAEMMVNLGRADVTADTLESLRKALFGENINYEIAGFNLNRRGRREGVLTGGNLSLLCSLVGTPSDIDTSGKILLIEDLDEYLYHIDRMMMNLKRSGKLERLAGLIVGSMNDIKDNDVPFGMTAYEIIADAVASYDYPVCFGFPSGHTDNNYAMILGRKISLNIDDTVKIQFL
ncbi:MAG: LD-carboxypeptidase [Bacteroidetes bacterium]|nr:LD-carboxypeptidase [Bacteroidota bacterium]